MILSVDILLGDLFVLHGRSGKDKQREYQLNHTELQNLGETILSGRLKENR
jgi:hypothetical protein